MPDVKKKFLSLMLAAALVLSAALPAFASAGFDLSVFEGVEDMVVMEGEAEDDTSYVYLSSLHADGKGLLVDGSKMVWVDPYVMSLEDMDVYSIGLSYAADSWILIRDIVVRIGSRQYYFTSPVRSANGEDGSKIEMTTIVLDNNSLPFMQDLIEHRDEEIVVYIDGGVDGYAFTLTQEMKDGIIGLYDRYVQAGGTRSENMDKVTALGYTWSVGIQLL